jgi:putative endonuclease
MARPGFVYLLASRPHGTLYVGVTSDLVRRIWEHRNDLVQGFTRQYGVHRLVYFERYEDVRDAIAREKQLKKWNRAWKLQLIREANPTWRDLYEDLTACFPASASGMDSRFCGNDGGEGGESTGR